jgi:hypothetical protein
MQRNAAEVWVILGVIAAFAAITYATPTARTIAFAA